MNPKFDYEGARAEGYTDDEINAFLKSQKKTKKPSYQTYDKDDNAFTRIGKNFVNFFSNLGMPIEEEEEQSQEEFPINQRLLNKVPNFDFQGALAEGYTPDEINDFLEQNQPERSLLEKGTRIGAQLGLGVLQGTPGGIAYDISTTPLASKEAQNIPYREMLGDELEQLMEKKAFGQWTPEDQKFLEHIEEQIKEPRKSMEYAQTMDVGIRDLAEKATGVDLHPEDVLEKAANWIGFIKNPTKVKEAAKLGLKPTQLIRSVIPSWTETSRGIAAGTALQMAEEGNFGPAGTIGASIAGDLLGLGVSGVGKVIRHPKRAIAEITGTLLGPKKASEKELIRQIISDAEQSGVTLDAGTLTGSNLVKMMQARAAQSGLSGNALDNFRKDLSQQVVRQYENVIKDIGTQTFENSNQAAESVRNFLNEERKFLTETTKSELNFPEFVRGETGEGRPLVGRISTEAQPNYQEELLNIIAPKEFENGFEAGEALKKAAEETKEPIKQEFRKRWSRFNEEVGFIPSEPHPELAAEIESFVRNHEGSLLLGESSAESRVLRAAERLKNALMTEEGALKGVVLSDLIKTKRTLGDVANWEFGGSNFQSAYKRLVGDLDSAIEKSLERINPELKASYEKLNLDYSTYKDLFENKNVMSLFEPKNRNYNTIYNGIVRNPDKIRSLENMMRANPRGQNLVNQVKRDYAQSVLNRPRFTQRDLRDLESVLGPQYRPVMQDFSLAHQQALAHPFARPSAQARLGLEVPTQTQAAKRIGKVKTRKEHVRQKLFEYIQGKSSDQIMKQMDSVDGIRRLKKALNLTQEGVELFNQLARLKLAELIDDKMMDSLKENVKLGTFSNLLKPSTKTRTLVQELIGPEAFKQLEILQRSAGQIASSAEKFYNASKSGTTAIDAGIASSAIVGALTLNPYLFIPAAGKIGGMIVVSRLLADPVFLNYLKEAVITDNRTKFLNILQKMRPFVQDAMIEAGAKSSIAEMQDEAFRNVQSE